MGFFVVAFLHQCSKRCGLFLLFLISWSMLPFWECNIMTQFQLTAGACIQCGSIYVKHQPPHTWLVQSWRLTRVGISIESLPWGDKSILAFLDSFSLVFISRIFPPPRFSFPSEGLIAPLCQPHSLCISYLTVVSSSFFHLSSVSKSITQYVLKKCYVKQQN